MEIKKEQLDDLNAVLKISVKEEDYQDKVNNVLKSYRKQAKIPGFRPGHVPMGMVKKMYGNSVLAEELNKIINEQLHNYIQENKLDVLGNPLPNEEQTKVDFQSQKEFEFAYDLGLAPQFDAKVTDKEKFNFYDVKVDEKLIDKNVNDLAKRYGKVSKAEKSGEGDMLQGEFVELDGKDPKENGIVHTSTIALEYLEDEKAKKALIGLKVGDKVTVDPHKVSKGGADTAAMLNIDKSLVDDLKSKFSFEVKEVYRVEPAALDQELFDKLFGKDAVKSEKEFREKIRENIQSALQEDSKRKLKIDVTEHFLDKLKLNLPDEFLKRWLVEANEQKLDRAQIEKEYDDYAKGLKWQLIQNKLIENHDIKVETDEIINKAKEFVKQQMAQYGMTDIGDEELTSTASKVLENREEANKIAQMIYDEKLTDLFQNSFKLKNKEVSYDEFVKLASGKQSKGLLNNIKNNLKL